MYVVIEQPRGKPRLVTSDGILAFHLARNPGLLHMVEVYKLNEDFAVSDAEVQRNFLAEVRPPDSAPQYLIYKRLGAEEHWMDVDLRETFSRGELTTRP